MAQSPKDMLSTIKMKNGQTIVLKILRASPEETIKGITFLSRGPKDPVVSVEDHKMQDYSVRHTILLGTERNSEETEE